MTNDCNGCISFKTEGCLLPYNMDCPCKKCLIKSICTYICNERREIFYSFRFNYPTEYKEVRQERKVGKKDVNSLLK